MRRRIMGQVKPAIQTVSLFHCDDITGIDEKDFARVVTNNLELFSNGKFRSANRGYIAFANNQWDILFKSKFWTLDFWINNGYGSNSGNIITINNDSNASVSGFRVYIYNNKLYWSYGYVLEEGGQSLLNGWNHIAFVRDNSLFSVYRNGVCNWSANNADTYFSSVDYFGGSCYFGELGGMMMPWDEIRFSLGCRWLKGFTPPTIPEN